MIEHRDKFGKKLIVGDYVVFSRKSHLELGKVIKLNKKMVKVRELPVVGKYANEYNKYGSDTTFVDIKDATFYLIKNTG